MSFQDLIILITNLVTLINRRPPHNHHLLRHHLSHRHPPLNILLISHLRRILYLIISFINFINFRESILIMSLFGRMVIF